MRSEVNVTIVAASLPEVGAKYNAAENDSCFGVTGLGTNDCWSSPEDIGAVGFVLDEAASDAWATCGLLRELFDDPAIIDFSGTCRIVHRIVRSFSIKCFLRKF